MKRVRGNPVLIVWKGSCGSLLMFLVAEERKESERIKTQVDYEREKKKTKMKKNNSAID